MKNKNYLENLFVVFASTIISGFCNAQSYVPDSTFNGTGLNQFTFYNNIDRGFGCALQQDQKLVLAGLSKNNATGSFELCIARLNVDGTFDSTFSTDGKAYVSMGNQGSIGGQTPVIKVTTDGKIVAVNTGRAVGGSSQDLMACRLDSSGNLDNTFNGNGVIFVDMTGAGTQPDEANALDIDAQGNLWITGATRTGGTPLDNDFAVVKITSAGLLDPTFDGDGKKLFNPTGFAEFGTGIKAQPDGKIVFGGKAGSNSMILRIDSTGALDNTFNGNGMATVAFSASSYMHALEIDSAGSIIVAASVSTSTGDIGVARYLNNGLTDVTFGTNGKSIFNLGGLDEEATSMVLTNDNKILIGGYSNSTVSGYNFLVARVDSIGLLDLTFNTTGYVTQNMTPSNVDDEANGIALMNDGRIILTGTIVLSSVVNEDVGIVRLKPVAVNTGIESITLDKETLVYPNPCTNQLTIHCNASSTYILYDLQGRKIKQIEAKTGNNTIEISNYETGVYFLKNIATGMCSKFLKM